MDAEPQTWTCDRCEKETPDPVWLHGELLCLECHDADPVVQAELARDVRDDATGVY